MEVCFPIGFALVVLPVVLALTAAQRRKRIQQLETFAAGLHGGRITADDSFFGGLDGATAWGGLDGQRVRLELDVRGSGNQQVTYLIYTLEVPNAVTRFEASPTGFFSHVGRMVGLVRHDSIGHDRIDDKYNLVAASSHGERRLYQIFRSGELESALDHLFGPLGLKKVKLEDGVLTTEHTLTSQRLEKRELFRVFQAMRRIADLCERKQVKIKFKQHGFTKRFGWTAGGEHARCPYCRDQLDLEAPDLVACETCNTLHHEECLQEAGRCTIFGCQGRVGVRVRS